MCARTIRPHTWNSLPPKTNRNLTRRLADRVYEGDFSTVSPFMRCMDLRTALLGVLQGLTLDMRVHLLRARMSLDNFFMLAILGEMVGVPVMAPFYSLRLLPYCIPQIQSSHSPHQQTTSPSIRWCAHANALLQPQAKSIRTFISYLTQHGNITTG